MTDLSQIPALAQQWMDAWIAQDRAALERFMAPDYALVGAAFAGRAMERATWLEVAIGSYVAQSCTFADPLVREISAGSPRVAAMDAVWTQVAHNGEHDLSGRYWITDLWREGGPMGWQVVLRSSAALDALAASSRAFAGSLPGAGE
jgi:hypothetical protein